MNKQPFSAMQRYAIWLHFGKVCRWCGEPVRVVDAEVDHVIPEHLLNKKPEVLAQVLHEYGLDQSFRVDDYPNWAPIHSICNKKKGGKLPPRVPVVVDLLKELRESAPKVRATVDRLNRSRETDQLLAELMAAVERGEIPPDELRTIVNTANTDADVSVITEQFRITNENWALLGRVERAARAGLNAYMEVVARRVPATYAWSPAFARVDLAHHIEGGRWSDIEDLGSVQVLRERLPGDDFLSRIRRALLDEHFYCAGVELTDHGLERPWTTEWQPAYRGDFSDWPCVHGLSANFTHEIPGNELLCGPPGKKVYEDVHSLVAKLLRVRGGIHRSDVRARSFNIVVHDPRGRILVEETSEGLRVRAEVTIEARLAAIFFAPDQGESASINLEVPREGLTHEIPGRFVRGKLKLWSRIDEPIDACSWSSNLSSDSPPVGSGAPFGAAGPRWHPDSPDYE